MAWKDHPAALAKAPLSAYDVEAIWAKPALGPDIFTKLSGFAEIFVCTSETYAAFWASASAKPLSGCAPFKTLSWQEIRSVSFLSQPNVRYRRNAETYVFCRRGRARSCHGRHQEPSLQDPANPDHRIVSCSLPGRATSMDIVFPPRGEVRESDYLRKSEHYSRESCTRSTIIFLTQTVLAFKIRNGLYIPDLPNKSGPSGNSRHKKVHFLLPPSSQHLTLEFVISADSQIKGSGLLSPSTNRK